MSEDALPVFSSKSFMVLCLSLKFILSLFLCMVWECALTSLIYMWLSNLPDTTCWRDCLFPIVYFCLLCGRLIDHRCVGLFLDSVFCSIVPYFYFCANIMLFWLIYLWSIVWSPDLFFFLRIALEILGPLWLHVNF